jgi:hypothetical protein
VLFERIDRLDVESMHAAFALGILDSHAVSACNWTDFGPITIVPMLP